MIEIMIAMNGMFTTVTSLYCYYYTTVTSLYCYYSILYGYKYTKEWHYTATVIVA